MARLVLGLGTSHGPMISTPPDQWHLRVAADIAGKHPFRGKTYSYDELAALRAAEKIGDQLTPEIWRKRHAACQTALTEMAGVFEAARIDAAIIVGDDQHEVFSTDRSPYFFVYTGETVTTEPASDAQLAMMPPGVAIAESGHKPPKKATYPCAASLARHIAKTLSAQEWPVDSADRFPNEGSAWSAGMPHAYGFIYRNIMHDRVIPHVPFFINTFFPPTQPSAGKCVALGTRLREAIESWPEDIRVALIASGGLTHFVIDENFDRLALDLMQKRDHAGLGRLPEDHLQSGNSEIKNWLPVTAACDEAGLTMKLIDYVPCYRSAAGTGTANAFAIWQ